MIVNHHTIFLKKKFIQDGGSGKKIELKKKVFEEYRVQKSESSHEPVDVVPLPPHRSSRISHPSEKYLDIFTEDLEKIFFMGERDIRNDPKTSDEAMLNIDSEK